MVKSSYCHDFYKLTPGQKITFVSGNGFAMVVTCNTDGSITAEEITPLCVRKDTKTTKKCEET